MLTVLELLDRAGNRLSDVNNALMLALNFSGDRDTVAADDVRSACADVAEETVWALTDAIAGKKVNVALHALHQHERMRLAWRLIESGAMNVTEAGEHVGYASLSHFSTAFKKQFDLLPSELRRRVTVHVDH